MTEALALEINGVDKIYSDGFKAVNGISLQVPQGDFFALLGPNGAGKSTTISIISSLTRKTSGKIKIFGIDIDEDFSRAKRMLGVVPQEFNFNVFDKCIDIVRNQAGFYGVSRRTATQRAEYYLQQLGLGDKMYKQVRQLSGGMKRRLMIARAMVHEPKLLILDEPTAGVDLEIRHSMWDFLQKMNRRGTTIILTTHYLEEAEQLCRNMAIINHGTIIRHGEMKSMLAQLDNEAFILDVEFIQGCPKILPQLDIAPARSRWLEDGSLEIEVPKAYALNGIFTALSAAGIHVLSMRNKINRLEELFLNLIAEDGQNAASEV